MRWERGIPEDMDLRLVRPFVLAPPPPRPFPEVERALTSCRRHGSPSVAELERLLAGLAARCASSAPVIAIEVLTEH